MRPGVWIPRSLMSLVSVFFRSDAENAETAIGVFCTAAALVLCAVTTISSRPLEALPGSSLAVADIGRPDSVAALRPAQRRARLAELVLMSNLLVQRSIRNFPLCR